MGDNAETAMIELVDFNEIYGKGKGEAKEAVKKTRRGGSRKKATEATAETADAKVEEAPVAKAKEEKEAK